MGKAAMLSFMTSFMWQRNAQQPISYQDVALQIFYASIFYPFANSRQLANNQLNVQVLVWSELQQWQMLCYWSHFFTLDILTTRLQLPTIAKMTGKGWWRPPVETKWGVHVLMLYVVGGQKHQLLTGHAIQPTRDYYLIAFNPWPLEGHTEGNLGYYKTR